MQAAWGQWDTQAATAASFSTQVAPSTFQTPTTSIVTSDVSGIMPANAAAQYQMGLAYYGSQSANPAWSTLAQQQQLQQWEQWQQQYAQWQQQYGEKYQAQLGSMTGAAGILPVSGIPPLPTAAPVAQPPPPEKYDEIGKKRSPDQSNTNKDDPKKAKPDKSKSKPETLQEIIDAEKSFDEQFRSWESEFLKWKEQNSNHPDKTQYREYEQKWESWREQLIQKMDLMKKKREAKEAEVAAAAAREAESAAAAAAAAAKTNSMNPIEASYAQYMQQAALVAGFSSNLQNTTQYNQSVSHPPPGFPQTYQQFNMLSQTQSPQLLGQSQQSGQQFMNSLPAFTQKTAEQNKDGPSEFLKQTTSDKSIPGLDLVSIQDKDTPVSLVPTSITSNSALHTTFHQDLTKPLHTSDNKPFNFPPPKHGVENNFNSEINKFRLPQNLQNSVDRGNMPQDDRFKQNNNFNNFPPNRSNFPQNQENYSIDRGNNFRSNSGSDFKNNAPGSGFNRTQSTNFNNFSQNDSKKNFDDKFAKYLEDEYDDSRFRDPDGEHDNYNDNNDRSYNDNSWRNNQRQAGKFSEDRRQNNEFISGRDTRFNHNNDADGRSFNDRKFPMGDSPARYPGKDNLDKRFQDRSFPMSGLPRQRFPGSPQKDMFPNQRFPFQGAGPSRFTGSSQNTNFQDQRFPIGRRFPGPSRFSGPPQQDNFQDSSFSLDKKFSQPGPGQSRFPGPFQKDNIAGQRNQIGLQNRNASNEKEPGKIKSLMDVKIAPPNELRNTETHEQSKLGDNFLSSDIGRGNLTGVRFPGPGGLSTASGPVRLPGAIRATGPMERIPRAGDNFSNSAVEQRSLSGGPQLTGLSTENLNQSIQSKQSPIHVDVATSSNQKPQIEAPPGSESKKPESKEPVTLVGIDCFAAKSSKDYRHLSKREEDVVIIEMDYIFDYSHGISREMTNDVKDNVEKNSKLDDEKAERNVDANVEGTSMTDISDNDTDLDDEKEPEPSNKREVVLVEDLICIPGRHTRALKIVIIFRGPNGSGKTYTAKLIKDKEVEMGGGAPRILSLDDYFTVEVDKEVVDEKTGAKTIKTVIEYDYDEKMVDRYRQSLIKAFKRTIADGFFPFIIVDSINDKLNHYQEITLSAKANGFKVYIVEMDMDVSVCAKRNIHNKTEQEIKSLIDNWEKTPLSYVVLDVRSLLQSAAITEVDMEDVSENRNTTPGKLHNKDGSVDSVKNSDEIENEHLNNEDVDQNKGEPEKNEDEDKIEESASSLPVLGISKWERMETNEEKLDRLDGIRKNRPSTTIKEWLELSPEDAADISWYTSSKASISGKKTVRWADLDERVAQQKMRDMGFVVGHTDWNRMMDPTSGGNKLTQTKYI